MPPGDVTQLIHQGVARLRCACGKLGDSEILSLIRQIPVEEPSRCFIPRLMALWH